MRIDTDADELARHRAVLRVLRSDAFLCGRSAAQHHRLPIPPRLLGIIEVGVPDTSRAPRRRGVLGRALRVAPDDVVVDEVRVTSAVRTFCDLARDLSVPELVAVADALATPHPELARAIAAFPDHRLRAKLTEAARLRDIASESPKESELRALLRLAGLPVPRCQMVVTDDAGRFVARVDLAFERYGELLEYQGDHHRTDVRQWRRDRTREATLESLGFHVTDITQADLDQPRQLIERVVANLRRRGWGGAPRFSPWFPG
ncbi:hypothetical protein [Agromyces luteolus]|uniref:DUF559 domain-containing protein n=1 Tax=Agromyces luteolus TaxID=88373 RepID=A0A7C9LVF8_9MICO|nr:hypothetical protein [Agromyces luteolus]MUN05677.1 hypothetical protein [Agromyces luteolus]